ncbi:zinc knuckle CX2CX4HX4C containing protein [Tanacetum coccineum]
MSMAKMEIIIWMKYLFMRLLPKLLVLLTLINMQFFKKNLSNKDIVVALFGVPLSSIEDVDVLTRKIEVGDYDELKEGMTSDEWKAAMGAVKAEWKKLMVDVTSTTKVPTNEYIGLKEDIPIVKSVSFTKPILYVEVMRASPSKPSTGKANFRHLVSDNVFDEVQILIPMNVVQTVSIRLENTLYGYFIGKRTAFPIVEYFMRNNWAKYRLTRLMMTSKGFFFFKFDSIKSLEDVLESGPWMIRNSLIICKGFTKEKVRVEYEWKPPHCSTVIKTTWQPINQKVRFNPKSHGKPQKENDGNIVHSVSKEKPSKAANVPSSSFSRGSGKNGDLQYLSSASNIHTSKPYNALDDMESDEEVENVNDETTTEFN